MKYCRADTTGVSLSTSWAPFKRVVNNGYTISTQSTLLIKQLEDNEQERSAAAIDWYLFVPGKTVLIDNFGNQYACITKTDGFVELQEIIDPAFKVDPFQNPQAELLGENILSAKPSHDELKMLEDYARRLLSNGKRYTIVLRMKGMEEHLKIFKTEEEARREADYLWNRLAPIEKHLYDEYFLASCYYDDEQLKENKFEVDRNTLVKIKDYRHSNT